MKKTCKVALYLCFAILFAALLTAVSGAATYENLKYNAFEGKVNIIGCSYDATSVTVPAEIDGLPVTCIEGQAFQNCDSLESIILPDSVTTIASNAFYSCDSLKNVVLGNNTAYIGGSAFFNCISLESINLPDSITSIGDFAFYSCESLKSIEIPSSVTSIGIYAFSYCKSLKSLKIGDGTTIISTSAFYNCNNLADLYICDLASWCSISFSDNLANPMFYADNLYVNNMPVTMLIIPDTVTRIASYSFYNCDSIKAVTIPKSVTSIGYNAFQECDGISSITIPDNVKIIDGLAFNYCRGLVSVEICNGVESIGFDAFSQCKNLTSITIPDSVTAIDDSAFYDCNALTIYCHENSYAQTYAESNSIPYVLLTETGIQVTTTSVAGGLKFTVDTAGAMRETQEATVIIALYGTDGKLTSCKFDTVSQEDLTSEVTLDVSDAESYNVFLINHNCIFVPLCENVAGEI